ncbi:C40 family peptidase [Maribacter arenosus]|uniref:C40 family peptidase n=1 Tax=Maribacter arenosus TaxID=1854708 RepID=A0ABR7VC60_9FLAO|nr:C40 family peptidase [Maribacter arenosus]MBD0851212.1 C40 family peptidase [Maribacter arenosus]
MNLKNAVYGFFIVLLINISCRDGETKENTIQEEINHVASKFAPDKRVALFTINILKYNERYVLKGESNLPQAVEALKMRLESKNVDFIDSIQILPSADLMGKNRGVIKNSVANLRSNPKHAAELATQAILGTPVKVYKKSENWYLIQTPDKYISWVDSGGVELMDSVAANHWKSSEKVIFTKTYGHTYSAPDKNAQVVSDIAAGGILEKVNEVVGYFKVKYPDGRIAYIDKNEAEEYGQWLQDLDLTTGSLVATSKQLMGVPYLWGGTSTKGVDCSGFTKTIYFLNGLVIPRDASQQVHTGKPIDSIKNFKNLIEGDLLFFGQKATDSTEEKVVHVGMWIGNNEFIHASEMVRVSSMDPKAPNFDEWNLNRYLRTQRILKEEDKDLINLVHTPIFND